MKQVLTVDDSGSVRQMVSFTLRNAGYGVTEAADGRQALDKARGQKFDLVITDLNMPVMDGIEMITGMRKLPEYAYTPVLMLSSSPMQNTPCSMPCGIVCVVPGYTIVHRKLSHSSS